MMASDAANRSPPVGPIGGITARCGKCRKILRVRVVGSFEIQNRSGLDAVRSIGLSRGAR
jgi:hypothetical protein